MGACVTGHGTVVLIQWSSRIIRNRWRWEHWQRGWDMDCLGWMFFEGKSVQLWVKPYEQSSQWLFVRCSAPFIDYGTIFHWGRTLALGKMVVWSRFCCSVNGELRITNTLQCWWRTQGKKWRRMQIEWRISVQICFDILIFAVLWSKGKLMKWHFWHWFSLVHHSRSRIKPMKNTLKISHNQCWLQAT